MSARSLAIGQVLATVFLSAFAVVLAKLALREVAPFTFVWLQIAIGGALLTAYAWARGERLPARAGREVWIHVAWIGISHFAIVRVLFMLALDRLPVTTHAYLINFTGIATMLLSILVLRERPSRWQVIGALLALAGVRVFFRDVPPPDELTGVVWVGIGVLALASTNNVARRLALVTRGSLSNDAVSMLAVWIGGLPVVAIGLASDWPPGVPDLRSWGVIALNGLVSIAIGFTVFNRALRTLRSYEASVLAASGVIYTALLAVPILGERLAWHEIAGIAMMLAGIVLAQVRGGFRTPRS